MTKKKQKNLTTALTTAEYLRQLGYLVEENIYRDNKNQDSDSSPKGFQKKLQASEERKKTLKIQFQSISDVEIIEELRERIAKQVIKLSIYSNQDHIFISASDKSKQVKVPLPIEIKEND